MKAQSKTIGMAIGVVLIIAIFTGVVLSSRGQAISSEISGNSEGGAALSLANTEDTEIIINELASEIPETGFFALGPDNYHEYTKEELFDYYGIEFDISSVFPDMIEENTGSYGIFKFSDGSDMQGHNFIWANPIGNEKVSIVEMSRNVQSGNTQNLKSMVIQRSFPKWSVAERRKTAAASDQAAVCACAHSRYFAGAVPAGCAYRS